MFADASWSDACILNISSRGLMIQSGRSVRQGSTIEIRRGEHVIVAKVMWRDGSRAGLQADARLPVDESLTLSQAPSLQLTAGRPPVERRRQPRRTHEQSRIRARLFEFAGVAALAGFFAVSIFSLVQQALAKPLSIVESALGG
jgi:hypothetical protein